MASMMVQNPPRPPADVADRGPCDVPMSMLDVVDRPISAGRYWMLAKLPARAMRALHAAARDAGIQLSSTGRTRSFEQQYDLFLARHTPVSYAEYAKLPADANHRRFWAEATSQFNLPSQYWKLKPGVAAAAVPSYTAPHIIACSDDLAELVNGQVVSLRAATLQWLYTHAPTYGFRWSLTSEPWHVQWVMGDQIPPVVLAYEAGLGIQPTPLPTSEEDDMPRYIAITAPGRNPALVAFGDAGCNVIGLDGDAISSLLPQYGVSGVTNVSTAMWDDFIAHKGPAK